MNWEYSGHISGGTLAVLYAGLLLFGASYNLFTSWAKRHGYLAGYTSLFVVGGVAVTVGGTALVSLPFALVVAGAFVASGLPMIVGDIWRTVQEREAEVQRLRAEIEANNGHPQ